MMMIFVINVFRRQGCPHLGQGHGPIVSSRQYCTLILIPGVCVIKVCSNGGATYILGEIIAKDNLNMANVMQIIEKLLLQNCSEEFLDFFEFKNKTTSRWHSILCQQIV